MSTPPTPLTPVPVGGPRSWLALAAIVLALCVVVGVGVLGRQTGAQQSPTPIASSVAAVPSSSVAAPTPTVVPAPATQGRPAWTPWAGTASAFPGPSATPSVPGTPEIVRVSGMADAQVVTCTPGRCSFNGWLSTTEGRLAGCFSLQTAGANGTGTWGAATLAGPSCAAWVPGPLKGPATWQGEWLTVGSRPWALAYTDLGPSWLWPVDTIWLHGLGEHEGLSAVLRIDASGQIDGWLFPTPVQSVATSAPAVPSARPSTTGTPEIVPVTAQAGGRGVACGPTRCRLDGAITQSAGRLPGCFLFQTAGGTETGSWGTAALASTCVSGWGFDLHPFEATESWRGEWFTAGPRQSGLDVSVAGPSWLWPVDSIWLHGVGEQDGLSAVLWIGDTGQIDGWLFPTPPQP